MLVALKNIWAGMGTLFVTIPRQPRRGFYLSRYRGFSDDRERLHGDVARVANDLRKVVKKAKP